MIGPDPHGRQTVETLDAEEIGRHLGTGAAYCRVQCVDRCDSTQLLAKRAARAGASPGWVVCADEQLAGQGRQGRGWYSPPGLGIWLSMVADAGDASPGEVTLSSAVALCQVFIDAGVAARIKWPNDVEHDHRKLAGLLVERLAQGTLVVGVGVNVYHRAGDFPKDLAERATSLVAAAGRVESRNVLAAALITALADTYRQLVETGSAPLLARWRQWSSTLGRRVEVQDGPRRRYGIARDISASGALELEVAAGHTVAVHSGSLRVVS